MGSLGEAIGDVYSLDRVEPLFLDLLSEEGLTSDSFLLCESRLLEKFLA